MPVIEQKTTNKNKVDFDLNRLDKSKTTIFSKYPKIDAVEYLDFIAPTLQKSADLSQHAALGVYHHIGRMSLQELRREPKAGFARAGRADAAEIEVAGIGGVFRAGIHGEPFRGGQQHIVFKLGIKERLDVCCCTP